MRASKLVHALSLSETSRGGIDKSYNEEIIGIIEEIGKEERLKMKPDYVQSSLNGNWRLIWTTEEEIKFFACWPFSKSKYVGQTIDFSTYKIQNTIQFEDGGYFNVCGEIQDVGNACETPFTFTTAEIRNPLFSFTAPPIGSGSFQTLYINERYRLSKELTRLDWSILERMD